MNIRSKILVAAIPISKFISKVHRPASKINSQNELDIRAVIKDGDVIMSKNYYEFSNLFIQGDMKHVGVYINGWVYEATTHGVRKILLTEFIYKKDEIRISRPILPITDMEAGLGFLIAQKNEPYDFAMMWEGSDAWYCSKLAFYFYFHSVAGFKDVFTLREVLGELTVKPIDFWLAVKKFERIYNSAGGLE